MEIPSFTSPSSVGRNGAGSDLTTTKRSSKPLRTYGSSKRRKLYQETLSSPLASFDQRSAVDVDVDVGSSPASQHAAFPDSAYQSMTATLDEGSDKEATSAMKTVPDTLMDIETRLLQGLAAIGEISGSARGKGMLHQSGEARKRRHSSTSQHEEEQTVDLIGKDDDGDGAHIEATPENSSKENNSRRSLQPESMASGDAALKDSPSLRTSGRQRKPSRKLEATVAAEKVASEKRSARSKQQRGGQEDVLATTPTRKRGRLSKPPLKAGLLTTEDSRADLEDASPESSTARTVPWAKKKQSAARASPIAPAAVASRPPEPAAEDPFAAGVATDPVGVPDLSRTVEASEESRQVASESFQTLTTLLKDAHYHSSFSVLKSEILAGLTGKRRLPLIGLDEEYQKVFQLVEQTIIAGEGNSMLVVGARGSAKSTLVETVLANLAGQHDDDFHVVRLNGFIHTDDKIALREIWRQLGREMNIDENEAKGPTNYADTLLSLLALLSHTAEPAPAPTAAAAGAASVPVAASAATADDPARTTSKSVIFVIDEFDLFASHGRQTLLYNLFDIAQSRKAPIAVLGLTTRLDVMESLEKRVKSRFSHRYVYLPWPKTLASFRRICEAALHCADDPNRRRHPGFPRLQAAWNSYVSMLLTTDPVLARLQRTIFARSKSVSSFMAACLVPVASMTLTALPTAASFTTTTATAATITNDTNTNTTTTTITTSPNSLCLLAPPDSKLDLLPGLSDLELSLLISAARLDIILQSATCNFAMAYDEYFRLASRARIQQQQQSGPSSLARRGGGRGGRGGIGGLGIAATTALAGLGARVWSREVALGAWERLEMLALLLPVTSAGGAGGLTQLGRAGRLWKVDVALEEIGACRLDVTAVVAKWCRVI